MPGSQPKIEKIFQTEFRKLKLTIPWTIVSNMNFMKYLTGQHNMRPIITIGKTRHVPFINMNLSYLHKYVLCNQLVTSEIREWSHVRFVQFLMRIIRFWTKHKWNYSLISRVYYLITYNYISWVTSYVSNLGFLVDIFILDSIDRELHFLERLELKFGLSSQFFDKIPIRILLDVLFHLFRFSKVSFYSLASSFMTF